MVDKAEEVRTKTVAENRLVSVSFLGKLDAGELLTGTPTVVPSPAGLTITNISVSTAAHIINKVSVPTGGAVQFLASGGTGGVTYANLITCTTDSTPAQTIQLEVDLIVE